MPGTRRTGGTIGTLRPTETRWCVATDKTPPARAELEAQIRRGEWLTPGEVAAVLQVGRTTVHRWLAEKETATGLPFRYRTHGSRHRRVNPADVVAVLDADKD